MFRGWGLGVFGIGGEGLCVSSCLCGFVSSHKSSPPPIQRPSPNLPPFQPSPLNFHHSTPTADEGGWFPRGGVERGDMQSLKGGFGGGPIVHTSLYPKGLFHRLH